MTGRRVLIAPDCFGGTLTAVDAAGAIARGWRQARPGDSLVEIPQSDGGPGFIDVLAAGHPAMQVIHAEVSGPLDIGVRASWIWNPATSTAYIECAQACGLSLLGGPPTAASAVAAHSRGVGQLVAAAVARGARTIVVGLGGSACTDGGRGMVEALGGVEQARRMLSAIGLIAASDVENPLLGPTGAAQVFGPQKGADPATVEFLEQRLTRWAAELEADCGRPLAGLPGAGAAGGLGAALLALGAERQSGAALIAAHTGIPGELERADLLITGEGRLDGQSLHGKVVGALAAAARPHGVPVVVLAGQVDLDRIAQRDAGIVLAYSVADFAGSAHRALTDAAGQLSGLARRTAEERTAEWE
ncbi:MAG: glycerate kinase family protein [Mycobacterium sp.]